MVEGPARAGSELLVSVPARTSGKDVIGGMPHQTEPVVFCRDFVELVADDLLDSEPPRRVLVEGPSGHPLVAAMRDAWGDLIDIVFTWETEGSSVNSCLNVGDLASVEWGPLVKRLKEDFGDSSTLLHSYDLVVTERYGPVSDAVIDGLSRFGSAIAVLTPWRYVESICESRVWVAKSIWVTEDESRWGPYCWVVWSNNYEGPIAVRWTKTEREKRSQGV